MSDMYSEIMVKRITPTSDKVKKVVLIGATAVCFVGGIMIWPLWIAAVVLGIVTYLMLPGFDLEYEYMYVNGEIDIDKIMGKQKRKRCATYDVENMEILAPSNSHALDSYKNNKEIRVKDYTSLDPQVPSYSLVFNRENHRELVKLELNENVVGDIRRIAPRKVCQY